MRKKYLMQTPTPQQKAQDEVPSQQSLQNKKALQELAQNEKIVQWVNHMVNYHRRKTEEKALLDLCLQCIYTVLFP